MSQSKKKINSNNKMIEECNICAEKITGKGKRVYVECPACDFKCCKACTERWLLSQLEPSCMSCKCKWTLVKCHELMGKGFMTGKHRKHVKDVLFNIEKARFPETMPEVEIVVKKEKYVEMNNNTDEEIRRLYQKIRLLDKIKSDRTYFINYGVERGESSNNNQERKKFIKACPKADCEGFLSSSWKCGACSTWVCKDCEEIIGEDKNTEHVCDPNILASAKLLKKETKPCPSCASIIYKISGCDQMWCTQCKIAFSWSSGRRVRGVIHNPHYYEWMKNEGETIAMPGQDMPCGGIPTTFAIMSAFSNKLKNDDLAPDKRLLIKDIIGIIRQYDRYVRMIMEPINLQRFGSKWIHNNKIYYPSDCGRRIENFDISGFITPYSKGETENIKENCQRWRVPYDSNISDSIKINDCIKYIWDCYSKIIKIHQSAQHFAHVELERQRRRVNNNRDSLDLRIKYILKRTDEKTMKTSLLKRDRQRNKESAILDIYEVYSRVFSDSLRALCQDGLNFDRIENEYTKLQNISKYCNEELLKYSKTFNLATGIIDWESGWIQKRNIESNTKSWLRKANNKNLPELSSVNKDSIKSVSIFDVNMLKSFCKGLNNIHRYGRRWSFKLSNEREPKYSFLDRNTNYF